MKDRQKISENQLTRMTAHRHTTVYSRTAVQVDGLPMRKF